MAPEGGHLRARVHLLFWGGVLPGVQAPPVLCRASAVPLQRLPGKQVVLGKSSEEQLRPVRPGSAAAL